MENIKQEFQQVLDETKEVVKEEIKNAFLQGVDTGAVSVCGIIYETFIKAGLESDNILFTIVKDIAAAHNCDNLEEYIEKRKSGNPLN